MHIDWSDQYRPRSSLVHRLDPRAKVLCALLAILGISLTAEGSWPAFAAYLVIILIASMAAKLGPAFSLRRSYVAFPFMLVALGVPFTVPGEALYQIPGLGWTITVPGAIRFASILLRTWLAVQVALLLTAITRFPDLLWALGALRLPKPLVGTIGFLYRYLFVLADEALRMLRARASRSPKLAGRRRPSLAWQGRVAGGMVGSLFLRSLERSERVYGAMVSRGYDGQLRSLTAFRMLPIDWSILLAMACLLIAIPVLSKVV